MIRHLSLIIIGFALIIVIQFTGLSDCSLGDTYPSFRLCVQKCRTRNCLDRSSYLIEKKWLIEALWNCYDDCEYECMWPTINLCVKHGLSIPQFRGKWPFIRWLGFQEPASVAFSFLNLLSTLFMYRQFYRAIQTTSVMYWTWTGHAVVAVNAWTWSVMFHIRDIPFTERMDYVGSSTLIYYTFFTLGLRMFLFQHASVKLVFILGCLFFFIKHISYLIFTSFDYHYNFDSLIFIGILTGISTLLWCVWNYSNAVHLKYIAAYVLFTMLIALLEIYDFPPVLWTFDAHSFWHLGTILIPYFLYKFAIEDCRYLRRVCHQITVSTVN